MESEKVKEIKKALEICMHTRVSGCGECPYNYTNTKTKQSECFRMAEHALTLINELESENESQKKDISDYLGVIVSCTEQEKEYKEKNHDLHIENVALKDRIPELEKENENLKKQLIAIDTLDETNFEKRHNAIVFITEKQLQQFAERLFEKYSYDKLTHETDEDIEIHLTASELDETLKEFIK